MANAPPPGPYFRGGQRPPRWRSVGNALSGKAATRPFAYCPSLGGGSGEEELEAIQIICMASHIVWPYNLTVWPYNVGGHTM